MNETIDLNSHEASQKLKELTKGIGMCMLSTDLSDQGATTRPMSAQYLEDDNNIWFISQKDSDKNHQIQKNPRVQLYFADPAKSTYVTVTGQAEIIIGDKQKVDELWSPLVKTWFKEGKDDPQVSLIKIIPEEGYYWDTAGNRFTNFLRMIGSVVSGKNLVESEEGTLKP